MEFPKHYDPQDVEHKICKMWQKLDVYRYDPESTKACFSVDTPPPYVSAEHLHVGHVMSYTQPEIIVRYKRMRGYNVFYPMGFDDNGLPTERYVERKYDVDPKETDRRTFIDLCLRETAEGARVYRQLWDRLGISVDWSLSYSTIDERSRRTAQKSFLELINAGLIDRRDEPIQWCYKCKTSLAQADVDTIEENTDLHDITFDGPDGASLIISTTRPELLPACVALYAHPKDERYTDLIGRKSRVPLFDHEVPIFTHPDVDRSYGSGLMMVCTWGDAEDVTKWREDNLGTRLILDNNGRLNQCGRQFSSLSLKKARGAILQVLSEKSLLISSRRISHLLGVHERCGEPVEFSQSEQWFIRLLDHKEEFLRRGEELNWYPTFMKARYDEWVKGLKWDWCISRQRHYGVPFPVWYCELCGKPQFAPESQLPVDPMRDAPSPGTTCECGCDSFVGESDVMDTWMTSSLTPLINARWAEHGFGEDNHFAKVYPQSLRVQAFEIIRTWLFYTIVKSHYHTDSLPWHDVMISGWGLDARGKKISKRYGNFVDPLKTIDKYSADAIRYWAAGATLGHDLRYHEGNLRDGTRLVNKLWNAARLSLQYLYDGQEDPLPLKRGKPALVDRWILSRLAATVKTATDALDQYNYSYALQTIEMFFFQEFCDNYLEIIKPRFRKASQYSSGEVEAARMTLHQVLFGVIRLFAPFVPFITEEIYQHLFRAYGGPASIHVADWPVSEELSRDTEAEAEGQLLIQVLTGIRRWKTANQAHANSPLEHLIITADQEYERRLRILASSLQDAARAERLDFGPDGDVESGVAGVLLKLQIKRKQVRQECGL